MKSKIKGMVFLACICLLAVTISPVSAGTGMESDKNADKDAAGNVVPGAAFTTANEKPVEFCSKKLVEDSQDKPVDYCQDKPVEYCRNKTLEYSQNKSVGNFNTKPVQYRQNGDVENYNTKPVEYCQNKPVEDCNRQTVVNNEDKPVSEYKVPEISEVDFSEKDLPLKYKNEASGKYPCDEITTSTENTGNDDLRKDAISEYLDEKWDEIKRMIIDSILSGKI